ncbi:hypothetical protein FOZ60_006451 [Perkinsus olseni]|uniref:Uncharacterized protein n=1 Tax=Perkinsus olseni TaxID=32597 RepID=A0A7J6PHS6_PEROL|nr:hypothetical protein FOZ60_006451 [Perkinsus olseni]
MRGTAVVKVTSDVSSPITVVKLAGVLRGSSWNSSFPGPIGIDIASFQTSPMASTSNVSFYLFTDFEETYITLMQPPPYAYLEVITWYSVLQIAGWEYEVSSHSPIAVDNFTLCPPR